MFKQRLMFQARKLCPFTMLFSHPMHAQSIICYSQDMKGRSHSCTRHVLEVASRVERFPCIPRTVFMTDAMTQSPGVAEKNNVKFISYRTGYDFHFLRNNGFWEFRQYGLSTFSARKSFFGFMRQCWVVLIRLS